MHQRGIIVVGRLGPNRLPCSQVRFNEDYFVEYVNTLPCPALPCTALPCPALPRSTLPYPTLLYSTLPYPTLLCSTLLDSYL